MTNFELFGVQIGGGEIGCAIRGGCWLLRAHNRRGIRVFTFDLHNRGMSGSFPCKGVGNWGWCCAQGLCTLAELNLGSRWRAQYAVNIWCPVEAGRASVRRNSGCNKEGNAMLFPPFPPFPPFLPSYDDSYERILHEIEMDIRRGELEDQLRLHASGKRGGAKRKCSGRCKTRRITAGVCRNENALLARSSDSVVNTSHWRCICGFTMTSHRCGNNSGKPRNIPGGTHLS
jgi:hypothetical protein